MTATRVAGEWAPLAEAARRLGLNIDQVRRRIRSDELRSRKTPSKRGGPARYEVWVDALERSDIPGGAPGAGSASPGAAPGDAEPAPGVAPGGPPGGHQATEVTAVAAARAAEM